MDSNIKFRGTILEMDDKLEQENLHKLSFYFRGVYHEQETIDGIIFFRDLMREGILSSNDEFQINRLIEGLEKIKRNDLVPLVKEYKKWYQYNMDPLKQDVNQHTQWPDNTLRLKEQDKDVSSSDNGDDANDGIFLTGIRKSGQDRERMYSSYSSSPRGKKRRKIGESAHSI